MFLAVNLFIFLPPPLYRTQTRFYSPGGREVVLLIVSHFTVLRFGPDFVCAFGSGGGFTLPVSQERRSRMIKSLHVAHVPVWAAASAYVYVCARLGKHVCVRTSHHLYTFLTHSWHCVFACG